MTKLKLFVLIASILHTYPALASEEKIKAKIISYGLYAHTTDSGNTWINRINDKQIKSTTSSPVHLKSTRQVPAIKPLFFGFEYQTSNLQEKLVEIDIEVKHPKILNSDGSASTFYKDTNNFLVIDGKVTATTGYLLESDNELTPGKWQFTVKYKNKTLSTQEFTVVKP